jgi:flavin reductase (DIM6/NTAB) family NADH-FMN oxidoreductase RutF
VDTATGFSRATFRQALSHFATGVTVVTTQGSEHPYGMTANAFASVSLDPPLVLICVVNGTEGATSIHTNGVFTVNVLSEEQEALSRYFASSERPRGWATFENIPYLRSETGSPILDGIAAHFDCRLASSYEAGDHVIFIGEVVGLGTDPAKKPLLFHHGRYKRIAGDDTAAPETGPRPVD